MAKPTDKQKAYAEARGKGLNRAESAVMAGIAPETKDPNLTTVENSKGVQEELARIRAETIANTGVTKEDVVQMLLDAGSMAKVMADPTGLVAAARELGKMLGFYAPEVKKTLKGVDKDSLRRVLEEMSDEELQKLANARVIDGQSKRVDEPEVPKLPAGKA